jgi:hypothetical protein
MVCFGRPRKSYLPRLLHVNRCKGRDVRQRKVNFAGKPRVVFRCLGGRVGVVVTPGPEQSEVHFIKSDEHEPDWGFYPNHWFRPQRERVKLKVSRVPVRTKKRVRLK